MRKVFQEDSIASEVNLPATEFFFNLDQIAQMLDVSRSNLIANFCFFVGRSTGIQKGRIRTINIAPPDAKPIWRVSETDFKIWLRHKHIRFTQQRNVRLFVKKRKKD